MNISTRSLETGIPVRVIVADAAGQILVNQYPAVADNGNYKVTVRTGVLDFYVIVNEPLRLTTLLNSLTHKRYLSEMSIEFAELPATESPENSQTATNIPSAVHKSGIVRAAGSEGKGEVSTDNGSSWTSVLNMEAERLASKLSLALTKGEENDGVDITVKKVEVVNIPKYGYILPRAYDITEDIVLTPYASSTGMAIPAGPANVIPFEKLILPEYIMNAPADKDEAVTLRIYATYGDIKNVVYSIPIRGNLQVADYSLKRNNHYWIIATLATDGETVYEPELNYGVAPWTDASGIFDFDKTVTFTSWWSDGVNVENNKDITITGGTTVEFNFILTHPKGANWKATITNPLFFDFDESEGGVQSGMTRPGIPYKIRIKPLRELMVTTVKTEFYITVDYGYGPVEIDLTGLGTGEGNRFTIIQAPN